MTGLLALTVSNLLNAIGLIGLRLSAPDQGRFLQIIYWGYCLCGLLPFLLLRKWRTLSYKTLWCVPWALSLACIYYLYVRFPKTVTFSQLVVIQSLAPFLALVIFHFRKSKSAPHQALHLKQAAPLVLLLLIAYLQWAPGGSPAVLFALAVSYLIAQLSGRYLSTDDRLNTVLNLNATTFLVLSCWSTASNDISMPLSTLEWAGITGFGLLLLAIQLLFLAGLKFATPVLSTLGISSSVPIGIGVEAAFRHKAPELAIASAALSYMIVTFWVGLASARVSRKN